LREGFFHSKRAREGVYNVKKSDFLENASREKNS